MGGSQPTQPASSDAAAAGAPGGGSGFWSAVMQRLQLLGMPAPGTSLLASGAGGEGGEGGGGATAAAAVSSGATGAASRALMRANSTLSGLAHQVQP